jgi:hypothetical protein
MLLILFALLFFFGTNPAVTQSENKITATMIFKVNYFNGIEPAYVMTPSQLVLPITVDLDTRFPAKQMSTITLMTVANGFNEHIIFNVPVNEHGDGKGAIVVSLNRINRNQRNEPTILNDTYIPRFTVLFDTLDYYAKK